MNKYRFDMMVSYLKEFLPEFEKAIEKIKIQLYPEYKDEFLVEEFNTNNNSFVVNFTNEWNENVCHDISAILIFQEEREKYIKTILEKRMVKKITEMKFKKSEEKRIAKEVEEGEHKLYLELKEKYENN